VIRKYICEKIDVATIYCKLQIYYEIDSNNCKLDEIFIRILNMNWLYHFNYNW
jgi:hypothetical protein